MPPTAGRSRTWALVGAGVAGDVRQRLLNDPEDRALDLRVQFAGRGELAERQVEIDLEPGLGMLVCQSAQRRE